MVPASKAKLVGKGIKKGGVYHNHKGALKFCDGHFHICKPHSTDIDGGAPKLVAHFSVSDTGESDIKIVVQDLDA